MNNISLKRKLLKLVYPFIRIKNRLFGAPDAVKVLLIHEDKVLLIKKSYKGDEWYLPGGYVSEGETPVQAAHREVLEELGVDIRHLIPGNDVSFSPKTDQFDLYTFVVDLKKIDMHPDGIEIDEAHWFPLDGLPQTADGQHAADLLNAYYSAQKYEHEHN